MHNHAWNKIRNKEEAQDALQEVFAKLFAEENTVVTDHRVRENQLKELIDREIAALPPRMREVFELSRKKHLTL